VQPPLSQLAWVEWAKVHAFPQVPSLFQAHMGTVAQLPAPLWAEQESRQSMAAGSHMQPAASQEPSLV
jgi:hypothetical protein